MRYAISDTHFGHENIIEYCGRPFASGEEMDATLVENWNSTVTDDDTVLFLGDVRHHPSPLEASDWLAKLNGEILVVRGNHDGGLGQNSPTHVVGSCSINHGKWNFYCEHQPAPDFGGWQLHGHVHGNAPFVDWDNSRVNLSVEVIGYEPLLLDELIWYLNERTSYRTLQEAKDATDAPFR